MKKITVCNQKGGAGKTTLTMLLATSLAKAGQTVGIIDLEKATESNMMRSFTTPPRRLETP